MRGRIRRTIEVYREIFAHYAGWDWRQAADFSSDFLAPVRDFGSRYLEEIEGIAAGAGVAFEDILAVNLRTEVINSAVARAAAAGKPLPGSECTALAGRLTAGAVAAQNWDWKPAAAETVVVLEAKPDDRPAFVTVVEAGLLAKAGMNAAGLGLVTNALVTDRDRGAPGVPYHVLLRAILESDGLPEAARAVRRAPRASSANYLIADRTGASIDLEAAPGGPDQIRTRSSAGRANIHTNHFLEPVDFLDVTASNWTDSAIRCERMESLVAQAGDLDLDGIAEALSDHHNYPFSVCNHPDLSLPGPERYETVASIIMDLGAGVMWLAGGNPCQDAYTRLDYSNFFGG